MQKVASRKIQTNTGAFSVSLPVGWSRECGITKGTLVDIFVDGEMLIITPHREKP